VAGCGVAFALLRLFTAIAPAGVEPLRLASVDGRVLLFGIAASLACGVALSLGPAFGTPKIELPGARATGGTSVAARRFLVGAELAVSLVLIASAGVLLQSFWNRESVWLGVRTGIPALKRWRSPIRCLPAVCRTRNRCSRFP
jgi:putative ABC transport system permease protein